MSQTHDDHRLLSGRAFAIAALGDEGWIEALALLARQTGSAHAQLIGLGPEGGVCFNWITDPPAAALAELPRLDSGTPEGNPLVAAAAGAGLLEIVDEASVERCVVTPRHQDYRRFLARHGIAFVCLTTLVRTPKLQVGLALLRSPENGATTPAQKAVLAEAAGQAQLAVRLQMQLEEEGRALVLSALEVTSVAAFLCDASGKVERHTSQAERIVAGGGPILLTGGRLRVAGRSEDAALAAAIAAAAERGAAVQPERNTFVVRGARGPVVLDLMTLPVRPGSFEYLPKVLVVARRGRPPSDLDTHVICEALGLTPAESEIARDLVCGASRDEIAAMRNVSPETIRSHTKTIFRKLNLNRVVDLAARLQVLH